jgi:hypothetical protein
VSRWLASVHLKPKACNGKAPMVRDVCRQTPLGVRRRRTRRQSERAERVAAVPGTAGYCMYGLDGGVKMRVRVRKGVRMPGSSIIYAIYAIYAHTISRTSRGPVHSTWPVSAVPGDARERWRLARSSSSLLHASRCNLQQHKWLQRRCARRRQRSTLFCAGGC